MPGPGHPGHFPKPPGWVDRPGGSTPPRPSSPADRPSGATSSGGPATGSARPGDTARGSERAGPEPAQQPEPSTAAPADEAPASNGPGGGDGGSAAAAGSRAAEAAARVAEMLGRDPAEEGGQEEAGEVADAAEAVEHDIDVLAAAEAARDEYLDSLRRLQADFENYKKRIQRQQADLKERAAEDLVVKLLPVLDTCDLALAHAEQGVEPIYRSLVDVLGSAGLDRIDPAGQPFDPNEHDAVLHEEGEDSSAPEVIEVLRAGYRWKGRVLRPAMVKVKG